MKHLLAFEDMIDSPCELMSKNSQRFCLAMFPLQFCPILHGLRVSSEEKHSSFRECPFQMSITDLLAGGADYFPSRLLGGFHQSAVGDEILHAGEAADIMYLIEDGKAEYPSDAWNRAKAEIRIGIMHFSNKREFVFEMVKEFIVVLDEGDVEFYVFCTLGSVKRSATPALILSHFLEILPISAKLY
jgi:hypothetical protein